MSVALSCDQALAKAGLELHALMLDVEPIHYISTPSKRLDERSTTGLVSTYPMPTKSTEGVCLKATSDVDAVRCFCDVDKLAALPLPAAATSAERDGCLLTASHHSCTLAEHARKDKLTNNTHHKFSYSR